MSRKKTPAAPAPDVVQQEPTPAVDAEQQHYLATQRQAFLDAAAIALYAKGRPLVSVWRDAEQLWLSRESYLERGRQ